jgi:phosphocarrier protein FPr
MSQIKILSPLSGQVWPLERIPDPVFAQKMVGDGLSIDPTDALLVSGCNGEVASLHAAGHAVTVRTPEGLELLMHIGIDTVTLKGQGFQPRVKVGDKVHAGDPLIGFELDFLATHAKSLLTQIVVTNSERVKSWERVSGFVSAGKDTLFTVDFGAEDATAPGDGAKTITSDAIAIPNPTGLHARPAAVIANLAKGFKSEIKIQLGDRRANARSVTGIMALDVSPGAKVQVVASGPDARQAVDKLAAVLASGSGDEGCTPVPAPATTTTSPSAARPPRRKSADPNVLVGVPASPGLAIGEVFQVRREEIAVKEAGAGTDAERRQLDSAIATAQAQLAALRAQLHAKAEPAKAAIFAAHEELLSDPDLLEIAQSAMAKGKSAAFGWKKAVNTHADRLAGMRNQLLAQRANDLRDVGLRVLSILTGTEMRQPEYRPNSILIAEDLTPSDTAAFDRSRVMGFCTTRGGATSHVAILARSLGIPALAGIEPAALELPDGSAVILDANKGTLRTNAAPQDVARIKGAQERAERRRKEDLAHALEPAVTRDGVRVQVLANIGGLQEAGQIASLGGEGVGLLRSEFLFMERSDAPSEEQQFQTYKTIAEAVGAPVIIRTLDVGGDKPLPYLPIPKEDNPFLGERGIRVGLDRPEILRAQLRAILRTGASFKVRIMFPMVSVLSELRDVKAMLSEEAASLGVRLVPVGIMVEVPAAAVMAAQFAREVDFFSIGTNDLTQYTLAMDRGHPRLAPQVDGLSPAVLKLIAETVNGARSANREVQVGVCGGIASDLRAVPILIGLGVHELSVSLPAIPGVKAQIRALNHEACKQLAVRALAAESADEVRALVPDPNAEPSTTNPGS